MTVQRLYSTYTHASCKAMQEAAMMALGHNLAVDRSVQCSAEEVELLREVVRRFGPKELMKRVDMGGKQ